MSPSEGQDKYAVRSVLNDPAEETERAVGPKPRKELTPLDRAKRWATDYLKRPHSEQEVRRKLREKGASDEDIETVIALCIDYGFINDAEYAGMIVRHYAAMGYGSGRIRTEFSRRGVPKELWDDALEELPEGTETIDRLLRAKLRGKDAADRKERDKAANFLYRKGYSWTEIRAALARYGADEDDDYDE